MHFLALLFFAGGLTSAATGDCSLEQILQQSKPDKKCVEQYLKKIPNEQDRSEAKFRLSQWKPIKGLQVFSEAGTIEAYKNDKLFMRTILLQRQKPMLIWMDGKILVDKSDNPSFARRLDNAMKAAKTSAFDFVLPRAHAGEDEVKKDLTLFYALDGRKDWGPVEYAVKDSEGMDGFLPSPGWIERNVFLNDLKHVYCPDNKTVGRTEFEYDKTAGVNTKLTIIPKSATEFVIKGLKKGQSQLVTLKTVEQQSLIPKKEKVRVVVPNSVWKGATISTCEDPDCKTITKTEPIESWNFLLRLNKEEEEKARKTRIRSNTETFAAENEKFVNAMTNKMFGLSVMGTCCGSATCRESMEKRFHIRLQPNPFMDGAEDTGTR